jgi:hypothetical protein
MLNSLTDNRYALFWITFHIVLGIASVFSPIPVIAWFYIALLSSIFKLIKEKGNVFIWLVFILVYLSSFELLARISFASPFIPYELGKYLVFVFLLVGILFGFRKGLTGFVLLILLMPALLVNEADVSDYKSIIFNILGPVNVALSIVFFKKQTLSRENFISFLKLLLFPTVSVLAYIMIKTPNLDEVKFGLEANAETTGGFGSNQVSTALGLGTFLIFIFWRKKWYFSGYRWLDLIFLIVFAFRGLLTFSRGGMLGGILGIIIVLALEPYRRPGPMVSQNITRILKIIPLILVLLITFRVANEVTGGKLLLRYKGETKGTLSGRKEKTLNVITSNRYDIFVDDLQLWKEHPVLGVGVAGSSLLRDNTRGYLAHVELSRLISEHGILGVLYFIILLYSGYNVFRRRHIHDLNPVLLAFFTIAIFTTFHAATRTYISPLLIGLSMITILPDDDEEEETALPE